jgi:bifunctional UDP-N-acetylglucosamine pyrophosphorylase/glucosamine-1-phosphate N-acetyltransferase
VGAGAVIAAGTTVTQDVPADSLVIARVAQQNRVGWAAKRRAFLADSRLEREVSADTKLTSAKADKRAGTAGRRNKRSAGRRSR